MAESQRMKQQLHHLERKIKVLESASNHNQQPSIFNNESERLAKELRLVEQGISHMEREKEAAAIMNKVVTNGNSNGGQAAYWDNSTNREDVSDFIII